MSTCIVLNAASIEEALAETQRRDRFRMTFMLNSFYGKFAMKPLDTDIFSQRHVTPWLDRSSR